MSVTPSRAYEDMRNALLGSVVVASLALLAVLGVAWFYGAVWACAVACVLLIAIFIRNAYQQQRLLKVLSNTNAITRTLSNVPDALGQWGEVFYQLHKVNRNWGLFVEQLQSQSADFEQAIQASPDAFILLNDAGCVVWLNSAAKQLLGLDSARDVGQNLAFLLRSPAVSALLQSQRQQAPLMLHANDKHILIQSFPYGQSQVLLLGHDYTDIERTERIRRDFVANVSHEIRTPLTVLKGYSELLSDYLSQQANTPAAISDAVQHMAHHSQRMSALTQDLLQLATLDAGISNDLKSSAVSINVSQWVNDVCAALQALAQHIKVVIQISSNHYVAGQVSLLDTALTNVVSNALRYTASGGTVTVSCTQDSGHLTVWVADTGCGIAPQHLPRLTERFYRVSESRSRDSGGTGLGLAIVKHIMALHGGELLIESTVGVGSRFGLRLPIATG